jgi:hypothetical protein
MTQTNDHIPEVAKKVDHLAPEQALKLRELGATFDELQVGDLVSTTLYGTADTWLIFSKDADWFYVAGVETGRHFKSNLAEYNFLPRLSDLLDEIERVTGRRPNIIGNDREQNYRVVCWGEEGIADTCLEAAYNCAVKVLEASGADTDYPPGLGPVSDECVDRGMEVMQKVREAKKGAEQDAG